MISKKQFAIIFLACFLLFLPYFFRPGLVGMDSYHFASGACGKKSLNDIPPLAKTVFDLMPCSFTAFKLLLFACLLVSTVLIACLGRAYSENGWIAGILIFGSSYWLKFFTHFEENQLALPFICLAFYLFWKGKKQKKILPQAIAVAVICFTALLIWNAAFLSLFGIAMTSVIGFAIAYPAGILLLTKIKYALQPFHSAGKVLENFPLVPGLYMPQMLWVGIRSIPKAMVPATWLFFMFTVFSNKWHVFLLPLLAIATARAFDSLVQRKKVFLIVICLVISASFAVFALPKHNPSVSNMEAVEFAVEKAGDLNQPIYNDWDFGWLVEFYGVKPSAWGGPIAQSFGLQEGVVVTYNGVKKDADCVLLREGDLNVFQCFEEN